MTTQREAIDEARAAVANARRERDLALKGRDHGERVAAAEVLGRAEEHIAHLLALPVADASERESGLERDEALEKGGER